MTDREIVIGVCGGVAAYKTAALTSALVQKGARVTVVLTESAKVANNCLLVISLPASDTTGSPHTQADDVEVGGTRGREAPGAPVAGSRLARARLSAGRASIPRHASWCASARAACGDGDAVTTSASAHAAAAAAQEAAARAAASSATAAAR